jgi:acylpyruvate hydrolase
MAGTSPGRLATVRLERGTAAARVEAGELVVLDAPDVGAVLERLAHGERVGETGTTLALEGADLAPVVPRPRKVICLGLNYRNHIEEMGHELPTFPTLFAKYDRALIGAGDDIWLPPESARPDWEVELAIVIGRPARRVSGQAARDAIAGFTVLNDVTMRDWQNRTVEWLQGKSFERTTPVGPWLVPGEELDDAADLEVRCQVDGETVQRSRTSELVFRPVDVVSYVSTFTTLDPGDLIATGTPGGVGHARDPQVYLQPGSVVRTEIEGIGTLVNRCVPDPTVRA